MVTSEDSDIHKKEKNFMKLEIQRFGKPSELGNEKRKKRKAILGVIIFLMVAVIVIAVATILIEQYIRGYVLSDQKETWAASIASYWGGIIGGMISGILAFLGVFYTIRYYKEADTKKERASIQPFLMVELSQDNCHECRNGFSLGNRTDDKEKQTKINVVIRNIGNGFAKTLVIYTGYNIGGNAFNKVINVDDREYIFFILNKENIKDEVSFRLQYIDSMTNEYLQNYEIKEENGRIIIECGYPQLIEQ